jgi:hypothetical protein
MGADGVVSPAKSFRPKDFAEMTTPSAALRWLRDHFLNAAATPPFQGGEYAEFKRSPIHSLTGV